MSGQQIGMVVGGVIGFYFGGPAGAQFGMAIGGAVGGAVDPETIRAPSIGDAQQQTTAAGVPRPVVYGHPAPFAGNLIDGEHKARKIIVTEGGKGGPEVESERFLLTSAIRICEGPIAGVVRIWRNGEVVYDVRAVEDIPTYAGGATAFEILAYIAEMRAASMAFKNRVRIYLGDEDQLPDPALEAIHGVGNTPYYRGTAYMMIEDDDVTDTRGACARYEFEVMSAGTEASVVTTISTTDDLIAGIGANPGPTAVYTDSAQFTTVNSLPIDAPYVLVSSSTNVPLAGNHIRARFETIEGHLIWDSGWHSDTPNLTALSTILSDNGRSDLISPPRQSNGYIRSPVFGERFINRDFVAHYYFAGTGSGPGTTSSARIRTCNQEDLPASWLMSPELPEVLIGGDGLLYYPDWLTPGELDTITAGAVTLASVISDVADRCGVPAASIDTTALNAEIIPGFLIAVQGSGADAIRPCQQMYFFDMPEFDGKIVAVKRGGAAVATITDNDMLEAGNEDDDTRAQAIEFPLKVSVITRDPAAEYGPMPQTSPRFSSNVKALGEVQIASPIPFGADEAMQRACIIHAVLWAQAEGRSEFELPEEWTRLVPSDCFERNGKRWMIGSVEYADGAVRLKSGYDRASNYVSTATGIAAPPPVLPSSPLRGPTVLAAMNLPPLREQDSVAGAYLAVTGTSTGWDGCTVQMSIDGGATYRTVATISRRSVMGLLTGEVGPTTEPIPVTLDDGELYDSTIAELDLGANAFALVPTAGQSEIGQFTAATEGDPGEYAITGTRRGVNGTDATTHAAGEQFVMLANTVFLPIDSSLYGTTLYFRAVTNGTVAENNDVVSFLFEAPPATPDYRITEAGDYRITEAGNRRTLE